MRAAAARYGLELDACRYAVAVLRIPPGVETPLAGDEELVRLAVDRICPGSLAERIFCHVFNYNGRVAVLAMLRAEHVDERAAGITGYERQRRPGLPERLRDGRRGGVMRPFERHP